MKKIFMLMVFAVLTRTVSAQVPENKDRYWREMDSLPCYGTENLAECKARLRREAIEKKRYQDSVKREQEFLLNKWSRRDWAKEKERRDKLTPEERAREDAEWEKHKYDDKKKIDDAVEAETGVNLSDKSGDPGYTPVTGITLGVHVRIINISDEISLGAGAVYSMQGGKYTSTEYIPGGNYGTSSATSRLNYLNFPVLIRYQKAHHGFFAEAGLQPGILVSAKNKGSTTTDIKEELKKFDVGIPVGVGYKFKNKVGVGLRVTPGMINVNKDEQFNNRNMVASLRAMYSF